MTARQKILLVDDSPAIHGLVRSRLAAEPVDVHSAYTGHEALAAAAAVRPDLVLLDIEMTAPDGFEVCRRLKADPATAAAPVVFLTASSSTEKKIHGLELGAVDYVTKPFDAAELRARVRSALRTKYLMDLLAERALIDGLTGLRNRACFDQALAAEWARSRRTGRPLACVLMDVDHFKRVNDTFGHAVGDEVLREIGRLVPAACRAEDTACRYGGEEFALILPETTALRAAVVADRLRSAVAARAVTPHGGGPAVAFTCSFGVADAHPAKPSAPPTAHALVVAADAALYRAKQAGRNRVSVTALPGEG